MKFAVGAARQGAVKVVSMKPLALICACEITVVLKKSSATVERKRFFALSMSAELCAMNEGRASLRCTRCDGLVGAKKVPFKTLILLK